MPYNNYNQRHFSDAEKTEIRQKLDELETLLSPKCANLDATERQRLGSINERNKLLVNKVRDYHLDAPAKSSPDVDWDEFLRDYDSRMFLEMVVMRILELKDGLSSAKILHDHDNYQAALTDYDYTKYKSNTSATLFRNKHAELSQFFSRSSSSGEPPASSPEDAPPQE